jgi:hypothetical protein
MPDSHLRRVNSRFFLSINNTVADALIQNAEPLCKETLSILRASENDNPIIPASPNNKVVVTAFFTGIVHEQLEL